MEFIKLYQDNQKAVKKALKAMWCSDSHSDTQKQYAEQISALIDTELFTSENYVPLVQCMDRYETIPYSDRKKANALVGGLWDKSFDPYKHQEESWKELSEGNSIVVTTGTGSGKTECFMLPLVNDLTKQPSRGNIKAIFLYPLNALMEDQKERLQELLGNTTLRFAVYNGNLPNDDGASATTAKLKAQLKRQVAEEKRKYPNIVPTRKELWNNPPDIILTNPTMLEYMLIRNKDQHLFTPDSLRWIVIDEAHTFTGAGAAELAMLLRRVLDAFNVESPNDIRFATSSATIGNAESFEQKNKAIVKFIQDITGSTRVKAIDGRRVYKELETDSEELRRCRNLLNVRDYLRLNDLFPSAGETIEEKLARLDSLCTLDNPLKVKVHFFYRVPTNGLRVRLTEMVGHSLKVHSFAPTDAKGAPYLELMRCEHCGEYFALGESVNGQPDKYKATSSTDNDIFDFDSSGNSGTKLIFSYTDRPISAKDSDGNIPVEIEDDSFKNDSANSPAGWRIVQNVQKCCPCCGERLLGAPESDDEDGDDDETLRNIQSFRVSGGFISRVIAPSILPNLMQSEDASSPHHGEQYISFVDSRQGAAKATMQQNLEEERLWIYSRIYHELIQKNGQEDPDTLEYREFLKSKGKSQDEIDEKAPLKAKPYMDWNEIFKLLKSDPDSERLAYQFVNKRELSEEYDTEEQSVNTIYKSRYIYSAMIEQLGKRPKKAAAPETLGLFVSYYPKLEKITRLPDEVAAFNVKFSVNIELNDWKSLLKMYLDSYVRSNESLYLKNGDGGDGFDIKNCCTRFGTTEPPRRPVHEPYIGDDKQGRYLSSIVLIATLIDPESGNINDTIYDNRVEINKVLKAFWNDLTETTGLIQHSQYFNDTINDWDFDKDRDANKGKQYRLNVADIAFKLYDRVWLCDSRMSKEKYPVPRPVDTLFKGYSPYIVENKARKAISDSEEWTPYPFVKGFDGTRAVSEDEVLAWAENNRKLLCDAGIWGRSGSYSERLEEIHLYPEIFIQAEHTAQVDKLIAKQSQELFKARQINILACSTTMEMGIDLGNLEMVVMTSVPPHPSNYKQRAGRSGRNDNPRSACITLCSSDSVGLRTLLNPMENLINRPMQTPFVDLKSPQVIQRHANAYLFRLSGIFFQNARGNANNLDQEIIEFFSPFSFGSDHYGIRYDEICDNTTGQLKYPCDKLGDARQTKYFEFKEFLNNCTTEPGYHLDTILRDTIYDSCATLVIQNCKDEIERCYNELFERADELAGAYEDARSKALSTPKDAGKVLGDRVDTGYGLYLRYKYTELLSKNLIEFFATNRFSPNANMPVNVVEFDLSNGRIGKYDRFYKTSNPSYPLQQAISQYSPGNTIVLENRTAVVRGLLYTGMFKSNVTFKKIYSDGVNTIIGEERKNTLQHLVPWPVNRLEELTMIEPYAFIPDVNEDYSRVVKDAPYTQVSAQLIGAGDWADFSNSSSLISVRSNRECGDANILYYNEGIGFGYCFCSNCGKAVLESAPGRGLRNMPSEMDNQMRDADGSPEYYHYMINRRKPLKGKKIAKIECYSLRDKIKRNVIIGGLIQTDYSEIRIRHDERAPWLFDRTEENLLITLGIVFTQTFVERLGKNRQDVDFAITPNGHLCIFDTNPGGSGYSNQLVNLSIMQSVIDASEELLKRIKTKDELIDRYTKRYYEKIDIAAALDWIKAEKDVAGKLPDDVVRAYPTAKAAVFEDILNGFSAGINSDSCLFVGTNWEKWLYQDSSVSPSLTWKARINEMRTRGSRKRLCVANAPSFIIRPIISILGQINDWADVVSSPIEMPTGLFPLAVVGGQFFFTNQEETTNLNADWSRGNVFCVEQSKMPAISYHPVSLDQLPTTQKFILGSADPLKIKSSELAAIVTSKMPNLLNEFLAYCSSHSDSIEITSQDEHLKFPISIVTTLQFFEWFLKKIQKPFSVEFLVEDYVDKLSHDIAKNIDDSTKRNDFLEGITDGWLSDMDGAFGLKGTQKIACYRKGTLPHWREIKFKCGKKELILYPNGGLINEWYYDRFNDSVGITMDTISSEDEIPLYRRNSIMYDIEIRG